MELSREFREGLRQELPVWEADGILTPGAARALHARYDLDGDYDSTRRRTRRTGPGRSPPPPGVGVACTLAAALLGVPATACSSRSSRSRPRSPPRRSSPAAPRSRRPRPRCGPSGAPSSTLAAFALSFVALADAVAVPRPHERGAPRRDPRLPARRRRGRCSGCAAPTWRRTRAARPCSSPRRWWRSRRGCRSRAAAAPRSSRTWRSSSSPSAGSCAASPGSRARRSGRGSPSPRCSSRAASSTSPRRPGSAPRGWSSSIAAAVGAGLVFERRRARGARARRRAGRLAPVPSIDSRIGRASDPQRYCCARPFIPLGGTLDRHLRPPARPDAARPRPRPRLRPRAVRRGRPVRDHEPPAPARLGLPGQPARLRHGQRAADDAHAQPLLARGSTATTSPSSTCTGATSPREHRVDALRRVAPAPLPEQAPRHEGRTSLGVFKNFGPAFEVNQGHELLRLPGGRSASTSPSPSPAT